MTNRHGPIKGWVNVARDLWNTWDLQGLLCRDAVREASTAKRVEKVTLILCAYGLRNESTGDYCRKPTSMLTALASLKQALRQHGSCLGDHRCQLPEGREHCCCCCCYESNGWSEELCREVMDTHLNTLDGKLVSLLPRPWRPGRWRRQPPLYLRRDLRRRPCELPAVKQRSG